MNVFNVRNECLTENLKNYWKICYHGVIPDQSVYKTSETTWTMFDNVVLFITTISKRGELLSEFFMRAKISAS